MYQSFSFMVSEFWVIVKKAFLLLPMFLTLNFSMFLPALYYFKQIWIHTQILKFLLKISFLTFSNWSRTDILWIAFLISPSFLCHNCFEYHNDQHIKWTVQDGVYLFLKFFFLRKISLELTSATNPRLFFSLRKSDPELISVPIFLYFTYGVPATAWLAKQWHVCTWDPNRWTPSRQSGTCALHCCTTGLVPRLLFLMWLKSSSK